MSAIEWIGAVLLIILGVGLLSILGGIAKDAIDEKLAQRRMRRNRLSGDVMRLTVRVTDLEHGIATQQNARVYGDADTNARIDRLMEHLGIIEERREATVMLTRKGGPEAP